jgi:hypothetical protein
MLRKGYPEEFSRLICAEMSTDFTAEKMMSYVSGPKKRLEDVADEMVAIQDHNCVIISESGYNTGYKRGLPVRGTACGGFLTWSPDIGPPPESKPRDESQGFYVAMTILQLLRIR